MSKESQASTSPDFLNPASMLTPGIAGAMTVMIVNSVGILLFTTDGPFPVATIDELPTSLARLALVVSFVFGLLVIATGQVPVWQRFVYYLINSLIIFSVAMGSNAIGASMENRAQFGTTTRAAWSRPPILLASAGTTSSWPDQLAQASSGTRRYAEACQRGLQGKRDNSGNILVSPQNARHCFVALQSLEKEIYQAAEGGAQRNSADLKSCMSKLDDSSRELQNCRVNWQAAEDRFRNCEASLRNLNQEFRTARAQWEKCNQSEATLRRRLQAAERERDAARRDLERALADLDAARAAANVGGSTQAALDEARRNLRNAEDRLAEAEDRAKAAERRLGDLRKQLDMAKTRTTDLERRLEAARKRADGSSGESQAVAALEDELTAARKRIGEFESQIAALEKRAVDAERRAEAVGNGNTAKPIEGRFFKPWSLF